MSSIASNLILLSKVPEKGFRVVTQARHECNIGEANEATRLRSPRNKLAGKAIDKNATEVEVGSTISIMAQCEGESNKIAKGILKEPVNQALPSSIESTRQKNCFYTGNIKHAAQERNKSNKREVNTKNSFTYSDGCSTFIDRHLVWEKEI